MPKMLCCAYRKILFIEIVNHEMIITVNTRYSYLVYTLHYENFVGILFFGCSKYNLLGTNNIAL